MTLPTFVATASGGDDNSYTSISVTRAGAAAANRVRLVILYRETNTAVTATGWTQIGETVNTGSPNLYATFFWHRDDGTAPTSWTFSWSGSSWAGYVCLAYDNVVTSGDPTEVYGGGTGSSNTITGPTITTGGADRLRMFGSIFFYGSATSFGNPSVGTRRGNINALASFCDENRASAGATGTVTIQANNTESGRWAAACFGLIGVTAVTSLAPVKRGQRWQTIRRGQQRKII